MSAVHEVEELMARDVFPAEVVEVGGRVLTKVRAFVTSHRLIVWGLSPAGTPEKLIDVALAESYQVFESRAVMGPKESVEVATLTRGYIVNKGRGCGCGGPLAQLKAIEPPAPWRKR